MIVEEKRDMKDTHRVSDETGLSWGAAERVSGEKGGRCRFGDLLAGLNLAGREGGRRQGSAKT